MKSRFLTVLFALCLFHAGYGLHIEVNNYAFTIENKPYTEIYIRVMGKTLQWKTQNHKYQSDVELLVIIKPKGQEQVVAYDKYILSSAHLDSIQDLLSIKRFSLPHGEYTMTVEATDQLDKDNRIQLEQSVNLLKNASSTYLSDIIVLGNMKKTDDVAVAKNGIALEPQVLNFLDKDKKQLDLYFEVYQTTAQPSQFLHISIHEVSKSLENKPVLFQYKKIKGDHIEPVIFAMPISSLRSGEYIVRVELMDAQKTIRSSAQTYLSRSNPAADLAFLEQYNDSEDHSFAQDIPATEIEYILRAHVPIADQNQSQTLDELIRSTHLRSQRQYIYQYWKKRSPANPEAAYNAYMEVARAVDKKYYSNVGFGFQTDRGHMFLKHGKPSNVIAVDTEIDAPPYEIWYYTQTLSTRQTNVRFLFYNPSLAHNDYQLLHSTCLGERSNLAWERELYKSAPKDIIGNTVDATRVKDNFNRNARRYFNDF
jgi:GWxTD domain-containing protein